MTPGPAPAAEPPDALEATLPLLRALPLPAILFRVDGTILAASVAFEELIGGPIEGADQEALAERLRVRYPTGRSRSWDDLRRSLERERTPSVAMDFFDRTGRVHAMAASTSLIYDEKAGRRGHRHQPRHRAHRSGCPAQVPLTPRRGRLTRAPQPGRGPRQGAGARLRS